MQQACGPFCGGRFVCGCLAAAILCDSVSCTAQVACNALLLSTATLWCLHPCLASWRLLYNKVSGVVAACRDLLLAYHHVPQVFDEHAIRAVLADMQPEKVRILWGSQNFQVGCSGILTML